MKKKLLTIAMTAAMTVACAITSFAATQVYFEDFEKGAEGDYTVKGTGTFDKLEDADFGTVYHNGISPLDESGKATYRNTYLLLPSDIFTKVRATEGVDGLTVGFWVKTAEDSKDWFFTPHFAAYSGAPSADKNENGSPMFIIQKRQILQVNCAGWSDFTVAQNDNPTPLFKADGTPDTNTDGTQKTDNAISTVYLDDKEWHYVTVTMTATKAVYYVDGEVVNSWTLKNSGDGEVITGPWLGSEETAALDYICLGGNQAWSWADGDVAMLYDDVAVYAGALTQDEVKAVIADKYAIPMTGVRLALESQDMVKDNTLELKYSVVPADTTDVPTITWTSSNEAAATVKDGVVTAVAEGTTTITITAKVGDATFTDECIINVTNEARHITAVDVKVEPTTILKDTVTNINVTITPANTTDDKTVTYTSSNEKIAKVDIMGVVTGIAAGDAEITVKVGSIEKKVKITVINPSPEASKNPSADASKTEDDATGVITAEELKKLTIKLEGMDDKLVVSPVAADSADYKVAAAAKELKDLKWVAIDLKLESGKQPANGTKITLSLMDAIKDAKYVKVFRVDGTKLVLVDHVEVKDGKFTFAPDHFSTYIFAATTEAPTANPNTGDSTSVALALALASIAAVALVAVRAKRRENA